MLSASGRCNDSKTDKTGPAPPIKEIAIVVSDQTSKSAKASYAPSVDDSGYFPSIPKVPIQ